MKISIGQKTDPGPRTGANEDSLLAVIPDGRSEVALLVVSDGMGGAKGGEHASSEAVQVIQRALLDREFSTTRDPETRLREAVIAANAAIHRKGSQIPEMEGMGCTVVVALVIGSKFWIASVGDSRAYLIRDGQARQLTNDHTWVGQQVSDGVLTAEQAERHSLRHVLDRALGADSTINVDVLPVDELRAGDTLLLCTDGLYGVLDSKTMAETVRQRPAQQAAEELVLRALSALTRDNVSAVVLKVE
jgi:protein phosphatase